MVRNARGASRRERKVVLSYWRCDSSMLLRPFERCMKLPDRVTLRSPGDSPVVPMTVALVVAAGFVVLRWLDAAHRQLGGSP